MDGASARKNYEGVDHCTGRYWHCGAHGDSRERVRQLLDAFIGVRDAEDKHQVVPGAIQDQIRREKGNREDRPTWPREEC